jgi:hypothetical protein
VRILPELNADRKTIEAIIKSAAYDKTDQVQVAVAAVIVAVAPQMTSEYAALLRNPATAAVALGRLPEMIVIHGFEALWEAVEVSIGHVPDAAARALMKAIRIMNPEDEEKMFLCAEALAGNTVFLRGLFGFSERFSDRRRFLEFINGNRSGQWRVRSRMLEQAILFVPLFGDELIEKAVQFACDQVAIIRSLSVLLWVELVKADRTRAVEVRRLLGKGWQVRMVAVKIIGEIGVIPELEDVAMTLRDDPVRNVRESLAATLAGTEWCLRLFPNLQEEDLPRI